MININALAITSEPEYFVISKVSKKKTPNGLRSVGPYVYEVQWNRGELANPDIDPIGVFGFSGNRRYIWRNKFWAEYSICTMDDYSEKHSTAALRRRRRKINQLRDPRWHFNGIIRHAANLKNGLSPVPPDSELDQISLIYPLKKFANI
jgi:hypothetical protein